jgi:hypothetical protein
MKGEVQMTQIIQEDGPMERELIAEIAELKPGGDRGKKLMTYVALMTPIDWDVNDPNTAAEWELMFCEVLTHIQHETGFSDEQMKALVNDHDEALDKWWEKQLQ